MEFLARRHALACAVAAAALCVALPGPSAIAATAEPIGAEYAIRWNAREGGPGSGGETLAILDMRARQPVHFKVDYYDLATPPAAPQGFTTILRRRIDDAGRSELTFKLRGDRALGEWSCPLRNVRQTKFEVDVTFGGAENAVRTYSYGCTSADTEPASDLNAKLGTCTADVTRWEQGRLKVEEWRLAGDVVIIEVSGSGTNSPDAQERFRQRVAAPLLAAGIVPSASSKTELGSRCR
jgi:hypothetical protein